MIVTSLLSIGLAYGYDPGTIQTLSASGSVLATTRLLLIDTTAGAVAATLPAINIGHVIDIQKVTTDANAITLVRAGSESINGAAATYTLPGSTLAFNPAWQCKDTAAAARWVG